MPQPMAGREYEAGDALAARFAATRALSEALAAPLSDADATVQSMDDASPAKWHLAHTTWFWETFLLRDHLAGYRLGREHWPFLFNSYYEAEGARHPRPRRGMLSRPSLNEILDWRAEVTEAMAPLLTRPELAPLIELGIAQTLKSFVGWMKGWALIAVYVYVGATMRIRPDVIYRASNILALVTLVLTPIFVLAGMLRLPTMYFVSPLVVLGGSGPEYFTVELYRIAPDTGTPSC